MSEFSWKQEKEHTWLRLVVSSNISMFVLHVPSQTEFLFIWNTTNLASVFDFQLVNSTAMLFYMLVDPDEILNVWSNYGDMWIPVHKSRTCRFSPPCAFNVSLVQKRLLHGGSPWTQTNVIFSGWCFVFTCLRNPEWVLKILTTSFTHPTCIHLMELKCSGLDTETKEKIYRTEFRIMD